jgi:organic hydroperoxide reductase OsmC/OhrA
VVSEHKVTVDWTRRDFCFLGGKYSREHTWAFDGGMTVPASPSPFNVPPPYSNPAHVDPEEAFVAAVSSCHMLTFLYLACQQGIQVDSYGDDAVGVMAENDHGSRWVSAVTLNPRIRYGGEKLPTPAEERRLHHLAHEQCIIANSVKTAVTVEFGANDES